MSGRKIRVLTPTARLENEPVSVGSVRDKNPLASNRAIGAGSTQAGFSISGTDQPHSERYQAGIPVPVRNRSGAPTLAIQRVGLRHRDRQNRGSTYEAGSARYSGPGSRRVLERNHRRGSSGGGLPYLGIYFCRMSGLSTPGAQNRPVGRDPAGDVGQARPVPERA